MVAMLSICLDIRYWLGIKQAYKFCVTDSLSESIITMPSENVHSPHFQCILGAAGSLVGKSRLMMIMTIIMLILMIFKIVVIMMMTFLTFSLINWVTLQIIPRHTWQNLKVITNQKASKNAHSNDGDDDNDHIS